MVQAYIKFFIIYDQTLLLCCDYFDKILKNRAKNLETKDEMQMFYIPPYDDLPAI